MNSKFGAYEMNIFHKKKKQRNISYLIFDRFLILFNS